MGMGTIIYLPIWLILEGISTYLGNISVPQC